MISYQVILILFQALFIFLYFSRSVILLSVNVTALRRSNGSGTSPFIRHNNQPRMIVQLLHELAAPVHARPAALLE
jgi:hypothetical protein